MKSPAAKIEVDTESATLQKLPAWSTSKNKRKNKHNVNDEARANNGKVQFATLSDFCRLTLAEHLQTYRGRVVLRGDSAKDDTGGCAVFTEQRASASHMTAAKVLDTISQLSGLSNEANDASRMLKILETGCPTVRLSLPNHWDNGRTATRKKIGRSLVARRWEETTQLECINFHRQAQLFLPVKTSTT